MGWRDLCDLRPFFVTMRTTGLATHGNDMSKPAHLALSRYFDNEQKFPLFQIWASHNKRLQLVPNSSMWENGTWVETN